jgi:NDP-sugar pyrophosphorylase family protein
MKTLLICPSYRFALPQLVERGPLAIAPILGECVASHWIEHLAGLGATRVTIIAADRADQVRTTLGDGARWGVQLEVISASVEPTRAEAVARYQPAGATDWLPAPHDLVFMNHLPGCDGQPLFESYATWFAALLGWMPRALTPTRIRVTEIQPGIWVGRRAHVSPTARLIAPCWIGDQVFIEPGAIVGPDAIIEDRSVVADEARVVHSWVGPDTFIGPMTSVVSSLAWGRHLTNWRSDSSLEVPDPFLMCSLSSAALTPAFEPFERVERASVRPAGLALNWLPAWPAAPDRVPQSHPPA